MTDDERVTALEGLGYAEREARFLCATALHSGYFVRRQFLSSISGSKGWRDCDFVARLQARHHCRETLYRHNRAVYRLCSKPFFAALGEPDNRNRREKQPLTIKTRLMALDFVLANPGRLYLATERDKIQHFHGSLGVPLEALPARRYRSLHDPQAVTIRYFVDKFPIFLSAAAGDASVVHFCYVDEGQGSIDGFETHLAQYRPLFNALSEYRIIYLATSAAAGRRAEAAFVASQAGRGKARSAPVDPVFRELIEYFETRKKYEAKDFSGFDTARVIGYRDQKRRFAGDHFEEMYRRWVAGEDIAFNGASHEPQRTRALRGGAFSTYELRYDYDLFGTV